MYDLDHMLKGKGSRQHLQQMIRQAQHEKFVRNVEAAQGKDKTVSPVRAILIALINLLTIFRRSGSASRSIDGGA